MGDPTVFGRGTSPNNLGMYTPLQCVCVCVCVCVYECLVSIDNVTSRNVGNVRNVRNLVNVGRWRNGHALRTLRENMETK